jgi:hypothetical protein
MMRKKSKGLQLKAHRLTKVSNADRELMLKATSKALISIKAFKRTQDAKCLDEAMESLQMVNRCAKGYHLNVLSYASTRLLGNPQM